MTNPTYLRGAIDASYCIGKAWELMKMNPGLYLGAGIVTLLMISCIPFVNFFLVGPMMGGFAYIVLRDLRGEPTEFGMLFKGFEKFLPLMVLGLIQSIPGIVFQVVQWTVDLGSFGTYGGGSDMYQSDTPAAIQTGIMFGMAGLLVGYMVIQLIWNAVLTFAIPLIIENDISIGEAITLSFGAVMGNIGGLILLVILNFLVALLGFLAFCIGILVAIPVTFAAYTIAYRQVFPDSQQRFDTAPPSPSAYGNTFGTGI